MIGCFRTGEARLASSLTKNRRRYSHLQNSGISTRKKWNWIWLKTKQSSPSNVLTLFRGRVDFPPDVPRHVSSLCTLQLVLINSLSESLKMQCASGWPSTRVWTTTKLISDKHWTEAAFRAKIRIEREIDQCAAYGAPLNFHSNFVPADLWVLYRDPPLFFNTGGIIKIILQWPCPFRIYTCHFHSFLNSTLLHSTE